MPSPTPPASDPPPPARSATPVRPLDPDDLRRTVDDAVSWPQLRELLNSGRQLRIKHGVDATAPDLHLGHAVNHWTMRALQEHGHKVVFLIGDVTTGIGDPTGRSHSRRQLTDAEITANADRFVEQVATIVHTDPALFEVRRNSEWFDDLRITELLQLLSGVTHARLIGRDMFQQRLAAGDELRIHELLYPVLQGYDSFALEADLTVCGTDQLFNEMMGRTIQQQLGQAPQVVVTTRITPGTDGREKQSKSLGNYVAIADPPREKFGKLMSIPDPLVVLYLDVYTAMPSDQVAEVDARLHAGRLNPRDAKRLLARSVVERYHGTDVAHAEDEWFLARFSRGQAPDDAPHVQVPRGAPVVEVVLACLPGASRSHARRLIAQGAVRFEGERLDDPDAVLDTGAGGLLRLGKRRWFALGVSDPPAG